MSGYESHRRHVMAAADDWLAQSVGVELAEAARDMVRASDRLIQEGPHLAATSDLARVRRRLLALLEDEAHDGHPTGPAQEEGRA